MRNGESMGCCCKPAAVYPCWSRYHRAPCAGACVHELHCFKDLWAGSFRGLVLIYFYFFFVDADFFFLHYAGICHLFFLIWIEVLNKWKWSNILYPILFSLMKWQADNTLTVSSVTTSRFYWIWFVCHLRQSVAIRIFFLSCYNLEYFLHPNPKLIGVKSYLGGTLFIF